MERTQLFDLMGELKLYGMKAAYDEIMTTAVKRQHEPQRIVGDLVSPPKSARSRRALSNTSSPSPSCRSPRISTTSGSKARRSTRRSSTTSLAVASSPSSAMPCWSVGPAPAKPTLPSPLPAAAFGQALAAGSTTSSTSSTGLRPRPATGTKAGLPNI